MDIDEYRRSIGVGSRFSIWRNAVVDVCGQSLVVTAYWISWLPALDISALPMIDPRGCPPGTPLHRGSARISAQRPADALLWYKLGAPD
jgi:hypothetical protein